MRSAPGFSHVGRMPHFAAIATRRAPSSDALKPSDSTYSAPGYSAPFGTPYSSADMRSPTMTSLPPADCQARIADGVPGKTDETPGATSIL